MTARRRTRTAILWTAALLAAAALVTCPRPACARDRRWFAAAEANVSFLGQIVSGKAALGSFAYRLAAGYRTGAFDALVAAEHGFWPDDEGAQRLSVQTMDVGFGLGGSFFDGRVRAELSGGVSILLTRSQLDPPGTTGFFLDARPAGFRWRLGGRTVASLYPLTFAFVAPVTRGIPLVYISYRTAVVFELEF